MFGADVSPRDIGFVNRFMISDDGYNYEIIFTANFLVSSHAFSPNNKMLQFNIESGLDKENVAEIIVPLDLIDSELAVLLDGKEIPAEVNKTDKSSIVSIEFDGEGKHTLDIIATEYLAGFLALESAITVEESAITVEESNGGGCLIATAAFGSELAPQVQFLREIRDNIVLQTESGTIFMAGFNHFYYLFSPTIADYERENPVFKEAVKLTLTPLLVSLTLLQHTDIDSELDILVHGTGIIILNVVMYFVAPAILILKIRKRVNIEKFDKIHV